MPTKNKTRRASKKTERALFTATLAFYAEASNWERRKGEGRSWGRSPCAEDRGEKARRLLSLVEAGQEPDAE